MRFENSPGAAGDTSIQQHGQQSHAHIKTVLRFREVSGAGIGVDTLRELCGAWKRVQNHGVGLQLRQHRGINGVEAQAGTVAQTFGVNPGLADDVGLAEDAVHVRDHFVVNIVAVEIFQDVGAHLQFGRANENEFDAIEFCEQVGKGTNGAAAIEFTDEGDAEAVQGAIAINAVEVEKGLRGMLAALAIACVNYGYAGGVGGAARATLFRVANDDHVGVAAEHADGVFHVLGFDLPYPPC